MNEIEIQHQARLFVSSVAPCDNLKDLQPYIDAANAVVVKQNLGPGESGMTITRKNGKHIITVNEDEHEVRQRFTICHEIGHIILKLPSEHREVPPWAPVKRDPNEIACDIFAAELSMPYKLWLASVTTDEPSHELIEELARKFGCSYPAAASRYATLAHFPCAFITMERGIIRYAARSTALRQSKAWIPPRTKIPIGSVAHRLRMTGEKQSDIAIINQDVWFQDWESGLECSELCRHDPDWDVTTSLIWFEDDSSTAKEADHFGKTVHEETALDELTGILPWPGSNKRRR
ncbi:MAG: ImmA/IrrE family metallo-endopeptidase [Candidatus Berkelbacteria bacterium]|nr:ImmA/IrrE family metallo-endopeptidase [Candidatus Berkelbacteria bacterium]